LSSKNLGGEDRGDNRPNKKTKRGYVGVFGMGWENFTSVVWGGVGELESTLV